MLEIDKNATMGELIKQGMFLDDDRYKINDCMHLEYVPNETGNGSAQVFLVYAMPLTNDFMSQFTIPESNPLFVAWDGDEDWEATSHLRNHLKDYFAESVMVAYTYDKASVNEIPVSVDIGEFYPIGSTGDDARIPSTLFVEFSIDVPNFENQTYGKVSSVLAPVVNQWNHFDKNKEQIFQTLMDDAEKNLYRAQKSQFENWISELFK